MIQQPSRLHRYRPPGEVIHLFPRKLMERTLSWYTPPPEPWTNAETRAYLQRRRRFGEVMVLEERTAFFPRLHVIAPRITPEEERTISARVPFTTIVSFTEMTAAEYLADFGRRVDAFEARARKRSMFA